MTGPQVPVGAFVAGLGGEPLGQVAAVYVDNATGRAAWAAVRGHEHTAVVPMEYSRFDGATLHIPFDGERLRTAPLYDPASLISYEEGDALAAHYGLVPQESAHPAPGTSVVRSEERLRTGTVNVVVGRARLVTRIVTENRTFTVPVRRQEVHLVHDAVPEHEQVASEVGPAEDVHEVVLHAEEVLFSTRVVPVERVRMVRSVVTGEQIVTAQLAAEQLDLDSDHVQQETR